MTPTHDVVIAGGGLAGLTLALQLKQSFADLDIVVLERRRQPAPLATHKPPITAISEMSTTSSFGRRPFG